MFESEEQKLGRFLDMAEIDLSWLIAERGELQRELERTRAILILAAGGRIEVADSLLANYGPKRVTLTQWRDEAQGKTVLTAELA